MNNLNKKFNFVIMAISILYFILFYLSISVDISIISIRDIIQSLLVDNDNSEKIKRVILFLRLPRVLEASIVGASLALSGALMQTILSNNLASPFTLGISSSASFGAALAIILNVSFFNGRLAIIGNAFLFSMISILVLYFVIINSNSTKRTIILAGISINYLFSSLNTLLQHFSSPEAVYQVSFWTSGSLSKSSYDSIMILTIILIIGIIIAILLLSDASNIMLGERAAQSIGINVRFIRITLLGVSSFLAASSVSMVGIIGFIGLVAPHLCRLLGFRNPRQLVPMSMLLGSTILVFSDFVSRRITSPTILPIGAITSLIGVPFFLLLIWRSSKGE